MQSRGTLIRLIQIYIMGSQCKQISNSTLHKDLSLAQPQLHPAFGNIVTLQSQNQRVDKAVKRISYLRQLQYHSLEDFKERIELVRECESVSTLIKIYDYEIVEKGSEEAKVWSNLERKSNCQQIEYPFILLHFQYIAPDQCLSAILDARLVALEKAQRKFGNQVTGRARNVKLNDYKGIDTLQSQQRQIANYFYQQIQIVRMIDHLVGALYFLHHYGITHGAMRPESILIDAEGKYVLADRDLFMNQTNYSKALVCLKTSSRRHNLQFVAPEWVGQLIAGSQLPNGSGQKSDIYCLGLLALKMCILDNEQQIFEYNMSPKTLLFKPQVLEKLLIQVKNKYSHGLYCLLKDMLAAQPEQRIEYSELIDRLNPILVDNLAAIKQLYNPGQKQISRRQSSRQILRGEPPLSPTFRADEKSQLKDSLMAMEQRFQRIMNNRNLLMSRSINEKSLREQQQKILSKLKQVQNTKTALRSTTARKHNPDTASPQVAFFQLSSNNSRPESPKDSSKQGHSKSREAKRYMTGKELQAIVWREYENIKSRRDEK